MADELTTILRVIVAEEFPTSLEVFDIEGDMAVADARAGLPEQAFDRDAHAGFGNLDLSRVSDYIKLVGATVAIISGVKSLFGSGAKPPIPNTAELQTKWQDHLVRAGIDDAKARRIARRFVRDLENLLRG